MGHKKRSAETAGLGHAAGMYSLSTAEQQQNSEEDVWRAMEGAAGDMYRDEGAYAALPLTTVAAPPALTITTTAAAASPSHESGSGGG
jgi:hypothetical protein